MLYRTAVATWGLSPGHSVDQNMEWQGQKSDSKSDNRSDSKSDNISDSKKDSKCDCQSDTNCASSETEIKVTAVYQR